MRWDQDLIPAGRVPHSLYSVCSVVFYRVHAVTYRKQICRTQSLKSLAPLMILISTRMK